MKQYLIMHKVTGELRIIESVYNYRVGEIIHPLGLDGRVVMFDNDWIVMCRIYDEFEE